MKNIALLLLVLIITVAAASAAVPKRPSEFKISARVKRHRGGASGELVEGEEDMRKLLLGWDKILGAEMYEVCHDCDIDDDTGLRTGNTGTITEIPITQTCGGNPCHIAKGAPRGYNRFNLRVKVGGEWSLWSKHRNYMVEEPGTVEHEEL